MIHTRTSHPKEPVDEMFTKINNYAEMAAIVKDLMTQTQKCKIAYIILLKTKKFRSGLKEWDKKDRNQQMWESFKIQLVMFNVNYDEQEI